MIARRSKRIIGAAVLALAVGAAGWWAWNRWLSEQAAPSQAEYPVRGIDISAHNGAVDFEALKRQGVQFAYIKATEGTDFVDKRFVENAVGARDAGIPAGAYHFFRFDTDGELQAWNFIRAIKGRNFTLPPVIDLEEWGNDETIATSRVIAGLKAFMSVLRDEGYEPVIYTNKDGYNRFVKRHLREHPLWICSFSNPPLQASSQWHIWQFSHRGTLDGISGYVDLNTIHPSSPLFEKIQALSHPE